MSSTGRYVLRLFYTFILLSSSIYSILFEQDYYGARALGLARSYTSIADNVDAIFWNAAGLSKIETQEASFMYIKPYAAFPDVDLSYQYLGYARSVSKLRGGVGIAWASFNDADAYKQEVIAVGIGRMINPKKQFAVGVTIKYLGHRYNYDYLPVDDPARNYPNNKYTIGIDAGILYNLKPNLRLGAVIKNINSPDIGIMSSDIIPMEIRVGINTVLLSKFKFEELIPVVEMVMVNDKTSFSVGAEGVLMKKSLFLRAGFNDYETAFGFGWYKSLRNFVLKIDYTYSIPTQLEDSGGSHKISVGIKM